MTAIANGIALHGGFIPYTSTFLMFVEYARKRCAYGRADEGQADHGLHP
ncbi:Transketolase 1 [Raoultella terrigena]|uniref:Transketolase 1 n=1 Tax=Raoultella terrigena TaxID=577 RepID=A0A4U9D0U8_RAOTE|nr:Transketolase 1 [Raoultella terrigena]